MAEKVLENIAAIQARIDKACENCGRKSSEVNLMLVTKTVPAEVVAVALKAGYKLLGENRVQEAVPKYNALQAYGAEWHLIGTLQTNKIKEALQFASVIQSLDRIKLAEKLHIALEKQNRSLPVYIEVNVSGEASKQGIPPNEVLPFVQNLKDYPTLKIVGLMTIGALTDNQAEILQGFQTLAVLRDKLLQAGVPAHALSMGMSGDMELAIAAGATMIRVGTAIFGAR